MHILIEVYISNDRAIATAYAQYLNCVVLNTLYKNTEVSLYVLSNFSISEF